MSLYEEIVFLQYHSKALWVVENVVPYYEPLMPATRIGRHLYWSNFDLPTSVHIVDKIRGAQIPDLEALHGYDLSKYRLPNKRQVLRNVVSPQVGLDILNAAMLSQPSE
jgi:DNA (cytosine-5)-methyltransferase 1